MAYKSQPTITRPANTTAYTAGDVVGATAAAFRFEAFPVGRDVAIQSAALRIDVAAIPSGMTSFRLHLYNGTPPSALADNAVWDLPSGDREGYLGYLDLGSPADVGSTLYVQTGQIAEPIFCDTGLYGYLVTNGAFTPAGNSEVYSVRLRWLPLGERSR